MTTDLSVANTIAEQIGRKAMLMIGAKNLMGDDKSLTFKIGSNVKRVTHIRVTLEPSDTYKVEFLRVSKRATVTMSEVDDVHVDALRRVIQEHTGMYTNL